MFCPNCGKENQSDQIFCRSCGLKLAAVANAVAELLPSGEHAALQRRRRFVEKLGFASLSIAALIAVMSVVAVAALYKLVLFGPEVLFWATSIALAAFTLLGAGFLGYSRLFMRIDTADSRLQAGYEAPPGQPTGKLLDDRFFEPVPGVTEHSTELLPRQDKKSSI
jgi:hypothetical protein